MEYFAGLVSSGTHAVPVDICHADLEDKMIMDSGCRRNLAGWKWHWQMRTRLADQGLIARAINDKFRFGDGKPRPWLYLAGLFGQQGAVDVAEVATDCPALLSIRAMEDVAVFF